MKLRPWQSECLLKATSWYARGYYLFLCKVAPAAGKTVLGAALANNLYEHDEIDLIIVVAPGKRTLDQWGKTFKNVMQKESFPVTGSDDDLTHYSEGVILVTWNALSDAAPAIAQMCQHKRAFIISDEHHHAGKAMPWGNGADNAFANAKHVLVLSGTLTRSDGSEPVWLPQNEFGIIDHPEEGTYSLSYGDCVNAGYCRPATFHRHEGNFSVVLGDGDTVSVSATENVEYNAKLKRIPSLQRQLDFYKLATTPIYDNFGRPSLESYIASMIEAADAKLEQLQMDMPEAGALFIGPNIIVAEYAAELIERITGEKPVLVHNEIPNAHKKIAAYENGNARWLVSVGMVAEGVDVPRLRVLSYLPYAKTELAFRQALGRVIRNFGPQDSTRAYVVMPAIDIFDEYARRVENEMPPKFLHEPAQPKTKQCKVCGVKSDISAKSCQNCDEEFPTRTQKPKICTHCDGINPQNVVDCITCGEPFAVHDFTVNLDQALRHGAIVRGMQLDEDDVQLGEKMAPDLREKALESGDEIIINFLRTMPDESFARLASIIGDRK